MLHTKIIDIKDKKLSIVEAENFISSNDFGASAMIQNKNTSEMSIALDIFKCHLISL